MHTHTHNKRETDTFHFLSHTWNSADYDDYYPPRRKSAEQISWLEWLSPYISSTFFLDRRSNQRPRIDCEIGLFLSSDSICHKKQRKAICCSSTVYPPNHHRLKKKTCKNSLDRRWCGDTRLCLASLICVWVSCCSPGWTFIAGPILIVTVDDYFFLPEMPLSLWTLVDI